MVDMRKQEVTRNETNIGFQVGRILRINRQRSESTIKQMAAYLALFWDLSSSTAATRITGYEQGGAIAGCLITHPDKYLGTYQFHFSCYADATTMPQADRQEMITLLQKLQPEFALKETGLAPIQEFQQAYDQIGVRLLRALPGLVNDTTKLRQLEELLK